jgi:hypothetical protein
VELRLFKRINFNNFSKVTASLLGRRQLCIFANFVLETYSLLKLTSGVPKVRPSLFALVFVVFSTAFAQTEPPQFMTVDGRLYDSSSPTDPLLDASVLLKIQVLNPAKTCILYEEEQTVSTLSSNGYFNVRVGSPTSDPKRSTDDSNNSMMQVFQNQNASIAGRNSSGSGVPCSYTPANGDSRFFRFIVTPSSTGVTSQLSPDMTIDSVPQALVAESLQGLSPDSFIRVNANTTQAKADNIFGAGYAALTNLISGTSSLYLQNTVNGTVIPNRATDPGSPTAGQIWYDSVANALKYYNGSTVQTLSTGVSADPTKLPLTGGAMTGNINMGGNQILGVGHITQNPQSTITLGTYTTAQQGTLTAALTAANKGATWFNSDTNKMMYWDGTVAQVVLDVATAGTVGDITAVTAGTGLTGGGVTGAVTLNVDIGTGATQLITNSSIPNCPANQSIQMSAGPIYTMSCVATTDSSKLALAGGTMTGNITMSGNQILGAGHIVQANQSSITIGSYTTAQETPFVATLTAGNEGTLWFNSDTNELKYWDGAAAQVLTNIGSAGDMTAVNTNAGSGLSGGAASGAATLQIVVDNTGIEINGTNQLQLKDAGVVTAKLADNAVTAVKVANNAITSAKILDDEITNADINASAAIAWSKIDKTGANAIDVNAVARAGDTMTGALNIDNEQELRLSEADVNGANYVALKAPATVATNYTLTLPDTAGTNGQVLSTNGSGVLSWITPSAVPANNSLNFSHFVDAMTLDASTDIEVDNAEVLSITNIGTADSFRVNDASGDTSPFVIDASGNVGIGTNAPTVKLQIVESNSSFSDTVVIRNPTAFSTGNGPGLLFEGVSAGDMGKLGTVWESSSVDASMVFYTRESSVLGERVRITSDGYMGVGTTAPAARLDVEGTIQIADGGELCAAPANAGMVRYSAGTIQYCNGSAWQTLGVSGAGLTTFNSQTGSTQTLAVGSTGLAPDWSSASNVHTLNIPLASGAGVTSGTISKTDYDAFNAKVAATRAVNTAAGSGLTGGGDLSVDRNLAVNITGTSVLGGAIDNADEILIYDISTTSLRKVARSNFVLSETEVDLMVSNNGYALATNYVAKVGDTMTGRLVMDPKGVAATDGGSIVFTELAANGTAQVGFRAPDDVTTGVVWALPAADGTSGQLLQTNGSGVLNWVTAPVNGGTFLAGNGSALLPSISFSGDPDTGMYWFGGNVVGFAANGAAVAQVSANGLIVGSSGAVDTAWLKTNAPSATHPSYTFGSDGDTGMYRAGVNTLAFSTAGTERLRISDTGNVGVGTSPIYALDVSKTVATADTYVMRVNQTTSSGSNTDYNSFLNFTGTNGVESSSWVIGTGSNSFFGAPRYFGIRDVANNNTAMTISVMGNVGFGLTQPTSKLHIEQIYADAAFRVDDQAGDATPFLIDSSGNVGIGTTSPGTLLDVAGAITSRPSGAGTGQTGQMIMRELAATGTNTFTIRAPDDLTADRVWTLPDSNGTSGQLLQTNGAGVLSWTSTPAPAANSLDFSHFVDNMALDASTNITADGAEVLSITNTGTGNSFLVNDQGSDTTPFVIDTSGNVGIGTSTPSASLHVVSNTNANIAAFSSNQSWPVYTVSGGTSTTGVNGLGLVNSSGYQYNLGLAGGTHVSLPNSFFIFDNSATAFRLVLNSSGNIGIGTTAPSQKLDVEGTILSGPKGVAAGDGGAIRFEELAVNGTNTVGFRAPNAITADILWELPGVDGSSGQVLQTNGAGVLSWITPSTVPAANSLDFSHFTNTMSLDASTDIAVDNAEVLSITNTGTGNSFVVNDDTADTSPFVIDASGNVGIGTTAPTRRLHVVGDSLVQGDLYVQGLTIQGAGGYITNMGGLLSTGGGNAFNFETSGVNRMYIGGADGRVGIGTTSPRDVLDVNGTVVFKPSTSNGTTTVNFGTGNLQHTALNCQAFALHNMKDGGSYTLAVKGTTSGTCSFTAFSDAGSTQYAGANVHLPIDHAATIGGTHTIYTFLVMGGDVYITWMPGL